MKRGDTARFKNLFGIWTPVIVVQTDIGFGNTLVRHFPPQDSEEDENRTSENFCKETKTLELFRHGVWAKPEVHAFNAHNTDFKPRMIGFIQDSVIAKTAQDGECSACGNVHPGFGCLPV